MSEQDIDAGQMSFMCKRDATLNKINFKKAQYDQAKSLGSAVKLQMALMQFYSILDAV